MNGIIYAALPNAVKFLSEPTYAFSVKLNSRILTGSAELNMT